MSSFIKKIKAKKIVNKIRKGRITSPDEVFSVMGSMGSDIWKPFVDGYNQAVDVFCKFKTFKKRLDNEYSNIDFNREIYSIKINDIYYPINASNFMYLYMLFDGGTSLEDNPTYVTLEGVDGTTLLTYRTYKDMYNKLNSEEIRYCDKLRKYIEDTILYMANSTLLTLQGITFNFILPLNTMELHNYHEYVSEYHLEDDDEIIQGYESVTVRGWNRIENAPIDQSLYCVSEDNPLIITSMTAIYAFVLDYLHYATIASPSSDFDIIFYYRDEKFKGKSVADMVAENYDKIIVEYINRAVRGINSSIFRENVFRGIHMS